MDKYSKDMSEKEIQTTKTSKYQELKINFHDCKKNLH